MKNKELSDKQKRLLKEGYEKLDLISKLLDKAFFNAMLKS